MFLFLYDGVPGLSMKIDSLHVFEDEKATFQEYHYEVKILFLFYYIKFIHLGSFSRRL